MRDRSLLQDCQQNRQQIVGSDYVLVVEEQAWVACKNESIWLEIGVKNDQPIQSLMLYLLLLLIKKAPIFNCDQWSADCIINTLEKPRKPKCNEYAGRTPWLLINGALTLMPILSNSCEDRHLVWNWLSEGPLRKTPLVLRESKNLTIH